MIEHMPALIEAGITSFKIEGRMKSAYYTAVVTNAYRAVIDSYIKDKEHYIFDSCWLRELDSVSHREYCTGYYFDLPSENAQTCTMPGYLREKSYLAVCCGYDGASGLAKFVQRNKVKAGDPVEIISPGTSGAGIYGGENDGFAGESGGIGAASVHGVFHSRAVCRRGGRYPAQRGTGIKNIADDEAFKKL